MKKGQAGTRRLNRRLQALLNPPDNDKAEVPLRTWSAEERGVLRLGDRVMQVRSWQHLSCTCTALCLA